MSRTKSRKWEKNLRTVSDICKPEIKTTNQHSIGNPNCTDYRQLALDRFNSDNELRSKFNQLNNTKWDTNFSIWKWFAEKPKEVILDSANSFQPYSLKRVSIHEASHAVIACLMFLDIECATVVPIPESLQVGLVRYLAHTWYDGKNSGNFEFWFWGNMVVKLAGAASEFKYQHRISSGCDYDIYEVNTLINSALPGYDYSSFFTSCILGVDLIINKPIVWNTIKVIADLLYQNGTLHPQLIKQIVEDRICLSNDCPEFMSIFKDVNEESQISHDAEWNDDIDLKQNTLLLLKNTSINFIMQLQNLNLDDKSRFLKKLKKILPDL